MGGGVPLADDKTVEPTEVLVFLGIALDTINMVMMLPQEIVSEIKERNISCLNSHKITLRELQSLIGILDFSCQIIVPGRTFS
jgi:predicted nucleic acid-binding protein